MSSESIERFLGEACHAPARSPAGDDAGDRGLHGGSPGRLTTPARQPRRAHSVRRDDVRGCRRARGSHRHPLAVGPRCRRERRGELLAIDAVTASYQGCNAMRLGGNGAMEFVWQGLCSIAGRYVRRVYNSAQWEEVPCAFVPAAMRRPRACSSRPSGLVTALCAAVGIAFLLAPPPAFAQSTTLVSNLDRPAAYHGAAGIYAQGFRTGANTAGYTLTNVQVRLIAGSVTSSTKTSVLIRQARNGEPGALVTALTTQTPLVDGVNTFAAPANTTLNPRTNYFITVNEILPPPTGAPGGVPFVAGPRAVYEFTGRGEQSGTDGWRIDDKRLFKNHLSQDWGTSNRQLLFIGVNGDVHTTNTEPQGGIVPPTVDGTVPDSSLVTNTHLRRQSDILHPDSHGKLHTGLWAQGFVTGSNRLGYTVTEIDIVLNTMASPEAPTVELHHTPHLNGATRFVSPPIAHRRLAAGQVLTYRAPSGTRLNPSTRYYVRVRHSSSSATEAHRVVRVLGDGEAGVPGGWSIDDNAMVAAKNNVWNYASDPDRRSLQIGVKGFPNAGTPGAPTGLVATADGTDRIDLSWHVPSDTGAVGVPVGGYRIEVSTDGGATFSDLVANTTNADTTNAHTGLQPGETRHYRVSAITSGTTGNASGVANATTDAVVPGAPTGLTATANGQTRIDLTWTAPEYDGGSTITGYRIAVSTGPQFNTLVADTGNANTSYSHTGLQAGDIRHYRVSAINSAGAGDPSNIASATIASTSGQVVVDPPTVDGTPSVSGAGTDAQWSVGETVGVTVTFSEAVDVDTSGGTPSDRHQPGRHGGAQRDVRERDRRQRGTELVFEYTLVSGDGSHSLMAVTPASLALNGGTIRSAANQTNAQLAHNGTVVLGSSTRSTEPEASFQDVPKSHNGATAFTVGVQFSGQPAGLSATRDAASVLEVTGGSVTGARVTSKSANPAWEVTVAPDGLGEVTIEVPVRTCTEANAVCIGGRSLSRAAETTVPGTPMTARFTQTPSAHDGSNGFELHMEFSHEPENFSYRTVKDALFDIKGGRIERVWRRERGKGRQWGIVVAPDGGGAVTLAARATTDCAAQNAACDAEGRKFAGELSLTVPGPASPPVVSIAASATPVTEGAAAAFTLSRTGATDAALTVTVSVSESEASVSGTPPTSVTFAAASASAALSVTTEDDEVAEDASTVTATVSSGSGYTVSGTSGSADVVVEDDDAAPVVATASPIVVAENVTAVATLSATDADTAAADLSWSIPAGAAGGADGTKFALTADGVLSFGAAKDYEAPDDTDTDGQYEVTVRVTDGANPVDAALVVRLSDVDDVAPVLSSASVDGAALTLTFGEALDEGSVPPASAFAVTVAGATRIVDTAAVSGSVVTLTLTSAVTSGETVTVSYTVPTGGDATPVKDAAGNAAATFSSAEVTNATAALPVVSIVASVTPVTEGAAAAFTLSRTGATDAALTVSVSVSESEAAVSGTPPTSATFAAGAAGAVLSVATEDDETVEDASTVTATVSSDTGYTVSGTSGSADVVVEDDDAAPVVGTASPIVVAENATAVVTLTATDADTAAADLAWSIPAGAAGGADGAKFALTADGALSFKAAKDYEAPDDADADGDYEVTVRVTDGANPVDAALLVRLEDADDAAPVLSSASVDGAALTLTFGEALDEESVPSTSSFAVTVAGATRIVDTAAVSGSVVTLTLTSAVTSGETVTVSYTVPTGGDATLLQDAAANEVASFVETDADNRTAPATPVVSIAPASTPVTEGTAAAFTLSRTGATAAELTVTVQVSEAGSVLDGTPPSSATFASGSAETRLSVATENDAADEADARVSASIVAGNGYEVDAERASAGVDVFDDDAAAQAVEELWSTTLTWSDLGNNWYGGFADGFSNPEWSEDGQAYRIWYISYDAGARTLRIAHDGSGGVIADPEQLSLHIGEHQVGPGDALEAFAGTRVGQTADVDAKWSVGEQVTVRLTRASGDAQAPPTGPGFEVADAQVNEVSGVPLQFRVTLDAPAQSTVSVRYRTENGTATAGQDYIAARGALRFAPGETAKTVSVAVLPDDHDEGSETMTLTLSAPYGATITDGAATGTISNTGAIPQAWIARFGRTVADQVLEAVQSRMRANPEPGVEVSLAGQQIGVGSESGKEEQTASSEDARQEEEARRDALRVAEWLQRETEGGERQGGSQALSPRDLLTSSSFTLTEQTPGKDLASLWGRAAVTRFDGREGDLTLDGEVVTGMLGADWTRGRWAAGLILSHSTGEGGYAGAPADADGVSGSGTGGRVEATLTGLFPWARHTLSGQLEAWGAAGYGTGELTVTPKKPGTDQGGAAIRADLDLKMAAAGLRGTLLDGGGDGLTLTGKTDALVVETASGRGTGADGGNLEPARAMVTRLRLGVEASHSLQLGNGGTILTPSMEVGLRHDGGDAETGFGLDLGAGLRLSDPMRGLEVEIRGRGLLSHESDGFRERGFSGALSWRQNPTSARGAILTLTQTLGGSSSGGADALLSRTTLDGLAANPGSASGAGDSEDELKSQRLELKFGYGMPAFDDHFTWTPEAWIGLSDTGRDYSLGWRLVRGGSGSGGGGSLELSFEARRSESVNDDTQPVLAVGFTLTARF